MEDRNQLPSLPGSDPETIRKDTYDNFYKKRPSEIWQGNVERSELKKPDQCDHNFVETEEGVECTKCRMGLTGKGLTIKDGHIYFKEQKLL